MIQFHVVSLILNILKFLFDKEHPTWWTFWEILIKKKILIHFI